MKININSEIGGIEGVIIHTPGHEVENMTPQNAERALYSDILNLSVASKEYSQFKKVLKKLTNVYQVSDLLNSLISDQSSKEKLISKICENENRDNVYEQLMAKSPEELSTELIQGVPIIKSSSLSNYLSEYRYQLQPLHNFFFTRDASISLFDKVLVGRLANKVREREAIIMEAIFNCHNLFKTETINPRNDRNFNKITIEGGDILVAREDIILVGIGARTTHEGVDYLIDNYKKQKKNMNIIVQELPKEPESFIHLDMVFTFLDNDKCLLYSPVILNQHAFQTVNVSIRNGKIKYIREEKNILSAISKLGMKVDPVFCGGNSDEWIQEREQWHSGANFFALGPGKIMGYDRNEYTLEEINKHGFEIIKAKDIINNKVKINEYRKYAITIEGAELARGGGGCRCMTMPICRKEI